MRTFIAFLLISVLISNALSAPSWYGPKVHRIIEILGLEAEFLKDASNLIDSGMRDGRVTPENAALMRSELKAERYVAEVTSVFLGRYSEAEIDQIVTFFEDPVNVKIYEEFVSAYERSGQAGLDARIRDLATRDSARLQTVMAFFTSPVAEKVTKTINDVRSVRRDFVVPAVVEAERTVRRNKGKAAQPGATDNPDDAQRLREDH